jgi:hypothetical protein
VRAVRAGGFGSKGPFWHHVTPTTPNITSHALHTLRTSFHRPGDILTDNTLLATKDTSPEALGKAIIARVSTAGHTVLECLGQVATVRALQVRGRGVSVSD